MQNFITEGEIPRAVKTLSVPITVGFFFHTMYNVTDTWFVAKISTEALAGLTVSFPLFFVLISLGAGFGGGITTLIGVEIGAGNRAAAAKIHLQGIILMAFIALLFAWLGGYLVGPGLRALGVTGKYFEHARDYTRYIYLCGGFLLMTQAINSALTAIGQTKHFRNFLIASFCLNAVLDPIFIFGWGIVPAMGVKGAAISTGLVNFFGIFYLGYKLKQTGLWRSLTLNDAVPDYRIFWQIQMQGIPAFLNMFLITVFFFQANYFINYYGIDAVAAFGIGLRIEQIALIPCLGINLASVSVIAQNYGARNIERIRDTFMYAHKLSLMVILPLCIAIFVFKTELIGLFNNAGDVQTIGSSYLNYAVFFTLLNGGLNINHAFLQGIKKPYLATITGFARHIIVPFLLMLPIVVFYKMPIHWLWAAFLLCSIIGFLISSVMAWLNLNGLKLRLAAA